MSGQSTTLAKGCMYIMFDIEDTALVMKKIDRLQSSSGIFQGKKSSLHEI